MNILLDKLILLVFSTTIYLQNAEGAYLVVPILIATIASSLYGYLNNRYLHYLIVTVFIVLCVVEPQLMFFIPLLCYDMFALKWDWFFPLLALPLVLNLNKASNLLELLSFLLIGVACLMKFRTLSLEKLNGEYTALRDSSREFSLQLENKHKELMEKQDYEINLATLNERNRIARDIHDNVGHLLSSSILQTGAMLAICQDPVLKKDLKVLQNTLSQGMDSVRESIHNLHDESIDLQTEITALINGFHFCPIALEYDMDSSLDKKLKYTFLSTVKEGLSNIMKHSNATFVHVTLRDHPALYQLIIKDNGSPTSEHTDDGIGLKNIADRVQSLNGVINFNRDKGFTIFISIPKTSQRS